MVARLHDTGNIGSALLRWLARIAVVCATLAMAPGARAAASSSTPVHLSPTQVAQVLFVAGDVGRLSQVPSGTETVVLETVLQQLYIENPTLDPARAVSDIRALETALVSGPEAQSAGTLTVMAGNQRVLAILRALIDAGPPADVAHALAQVTDHALIDASQSTQMFGQQFDASADSLDTLTYSSFSPVRVLAATAALAALNRSFGLARDTLWEKAANESVFDGTHTLLTENPALQNAAITSFGRTLASDGSLTTTVGELEGLVNRSVSQIDDQSCTLAAGTNGSSPSDCASGALRDAQVVAQQCPNGAGSTGASCQSARNQAQSDAAGELATIRAQQAAAAAEADALAGADQQLAQAEIAEGQAAAQVADEENDYLSFQSFQQFETAGFDVTALITTLSVAEIDPTWAMTGALSVVGDAIGFGFGGPDPNTLILQSIQNLAQQLSDFEQYTQSAFHAIDSQLAGISNQIAQNAFALSAQLSAAQLQITQLATSLTNLQDSVDHLESEVQSLFAQGARNDLGTLIDQYIGYQQNNGVPLPQSQFAIAAGALYQDATSTALTQTVLNVPTGFDAVNAANLVTADDPLTLDSNIDFFNAFPAEETDAPSIMWPGPLTSTCAPNADLAHDLCLPDPDFWATSSRAFAQLLMENPTYVTPSRLEQLTAMREEGQLIANALHQLSVNDAGSDANGTGNQTLDSAIRYYLYWGGVTLHPSGTAPTLSQALHNEEQRYLASQTVPGQTFSYGGLDPWGGVSQNPDTTTLLGTSSFASAVPICSAEAADLPPAVGSLTIPHLTLGTMSFLPAPVLNALRLGIGHVDECWEADRTGMAPFPDLNMTISYFYHSADNSIVEQVGEANATEFNIPRCADPDDATIDAVEDVASSWPGVANPNPSCFDMSPLLSMSVNQTTTYPSDVQGYVEPAIAAVFTDLQRRIYEDILSNGSTLTAGGGQDSDIEAAATRLAGATALLNGYISLGLPQALASDDTLHSLIAGANEDAFAPTDPNFNLWNVATASTVPAQIVNFYKAALAVMPTFNPADFAADLVSERATNLSAAIRPHIVPSTSQLAPGLGRRAAATPPNTIFAETNPLIAPTIDRLEESQVALTDAIANGASLFVVVTGTGHGTVSNPGNISCPGTCSHSYTPGTAVTLSAAPAEGSSFGGWSGACTGTGDCIVPMSYDQQVIATFTANPSGPSGHASPPACTVRSKSNRVLLHKPKRKRHGRTRRSAVKPGTLALSVKCDQAARVRLAGTLTRLLGKKSKHRRQRARRTRLGPDVAAVSAGRSATLTLKLPSAALKALARHVKESVTVTVTATNADGTGEAATNIKSLIPR